MPSLSTPSVKPVGGVVKPQKAPVTPQTPARPVPEGVKLTPKEREQWLQSADQLTDQEYLDLHKGNVKEFLKTVSSINPQEMEHMALGGKAKRDWYRDTAKFLFNTFHDPKHPETLDDAYRFAGLLAATSPRISVPTSFNLSLDIWKHWNEAGRPKNPEAIKTLLHNMTAEWKQNAEIEHARQGVKLVRKQAFDVKTGKPFTKEVWEKDPGKALFEIPGKEVHLPRGLVKVGEKYLPWAHPANRGVHLPNITRVLSFQPSDAKGWKDLKVADLGKYKVNSFFHNMTGNLNRVTNDVWAAAMTGLDQKLFSKPQVYHAVSVVTRKVANQLNRSLGNGETPWEAADVQAAAWSFFRGIARKMQQEGLTPKEAIREITHEDLGESADIAEDALRNEHISQRLQQLGLGRAVKRLATRQQKEKEAKPALTGRAVEGHHALLERVGGFADKAKGAFKRVKYEALKPVPPSSWVKSVLAYLKAA